MYTEEFFIDANDLTAGAVLDRSMTGALCRGSHPDRSDAEVGAALCRLVHDDLEAFGTDGNQRLDEEDMRLAIRSLRAVLLRVGLTVSLPFRDFGSFKTHWIANDAKGSWQARRDILDDQVQ